MDTCDNSVIQHFNFRVIFNYFSLLNTRNIFIVNSNLLLVRVCISMSCIFVPSIFWNLISNCSLLSFVPGR